MKYFLSTLLIASLFCACTPTVVTPSSAPSATPCLMTVFVHGTIKPPRITLSMVSNILNQTNPETRPLYQRVNDKLRDNLYLHQSQAMQQRGLVMINAHHKESKQGAHCLKMVFEKEYDFYKLYPIKRLYYTQGWSGLLHAKDRLEEGKKFYKELEQEVIRLRATGYQPIIHIIGYSHGGSVALNLIAGLEESKKPAPFHIDQLVLLAMPVQKETDHYISRTEFFKKIYHIYSITDNIQPSDFLSTTKSLSSAVVFKKRAGFRLPNTLTQVQIRITKELKRLPKKSSQKKVADPVENSHTLLATPGIKRIHQDPGHTEFFDFGWGDSVWFRQYFTLYPLPIIAFVPAIVHALSTYAPEAHSVVFDYCPSVSGARITSDSQKDAFTVPILSKPFLQNLKEDVMHCMPDNFSREEAQKEALTAFEQAYQELKQETRSAKSKRKLFMSYVSLSNYMGIDLVPYV